jgi:hypothetical protein
MNRAEIADPRVPSNLIRFIPAEGGTAGANPPPTSEELGGIGHE